MAFFSLIAASCSPMPAQQPEATRSTPSPAPPTRTLSPTEGQKAIPIATLNAKATTEAFQALCDQVEPGTGPGFIYPPEGDWVAVGCGTRDSHFLVIANHEGLKWILYFSDYLSVDYELPGWFLPMAWSLEKGYFYFAKDIGHSGGGNQCFPGLGVYGLYRLELETGTVVTLVTTDDFSGKQIQFSPTVEYYAVSYPGLTLTNLENGDVTKIDVSGIMALSWSPDGRHLAYSVASCGDWLVESSSIYVWDSSAKETRILFSSSDMLLRPILWINNSLLEFTGEIWDGPDDLITVFHFDIASDEMIFSATATPYP